MANISRSFTKYAVYYLSGSSPAVGMAQDAEIDCFDDNGQRVGAFYFYPEGIALPANQNTVNGIYLNFRSSRFGDVMTMLKEEKPLYMSLDTVRKTGCIGTQWEPVGEQEASAGA